MIVTSKWIFNKSDDKEIPFAVHAHTMKPFFIASVGTTSTAHLEKKTIDQMRTKPNNGLSKLDNTYREGGFITNNSCCYPSGTVSPLSGGIDAIELMMNKEEEEVDTCDRITVETTTCHWTKGGCTCGHDVTCLNKPITNSAFVHHDNDVVEGSSGWSQSPDTSLCNEVRSSIVNLWDIIFGLYDLLVHVHVCKQGHSSWVCILDSGLIIVW